MPDAESESFANRPTASFKPGHGITVSNWRNKGSEGDFTTTSLETSWQEKGSDDWKSRKVSLNFDALPHAIIALQEAYRAQLLERSQQRSGAARAA